jgi:hypothetical protein
VAATLCSFISTTALAVYKAQDLANRLAKAQGARARLEALSTFLEITDISVERAAAQYTQIVQDVEFIPGAVGNAQQQAEPGNA